VDISRLPATVEQNEDGALRIGAAVRNSDLAADPRIRRGYPVLSEALLAGASGQLRNLATSGGNLLQRTRCLYFQDVTKPCNKREPGSGCPAREGLHRDLAVLGHSEACIATHPSDMAVALTALDAHVVVTGPGGPGRIPIDEFHRLPGDDPTRDTVLRHGDLITAIELPAPSALSRNSGYRKARDRASFAFAIGSVATAITVADGTVTDVRVVLGAVAHKPWRARVAEQAIIGGPAGAHAFEAALDLELSAAQPFPDNAFKVPLARNLAVSQLCRLAGVEMPVPAVGPAGRGGHDADGGNR
jgi:xanthine dehydrogenase YagS FAD-binding subunit